MKSSVLLLLTITALTLAQESGFKVPEDDKIGFVFEVVRHGARAPIIDDGNAFSVPMGNLTESGMRQRYLMGRVVRQKYFEDYGLLDEAYLASQLYIQTSFVYRVIQSTYSQLVGFFPPKTSSQQLSEGELKSLSDGKGMPPFKIKLGEELSDRLGKQAIIDGIAQYPVFTYSTPNLQDDIKYEGCSYVKSCDVYYWTHPEVAFAEEYDKIYPIIKEPFMAAFDMTEEEADSLLFTDLYNLADILVSEDYQGLERRYNFSQEEWYYVNNIQKWSLINTFTPDCRAVMDTKFMRLGVVKMMEMVEKLLEKDLSKDSLRYIIYSAHDYQVANLLEFFAFDNLHYYYIPYASQIYFELHYQDQCLDEVGDSSCFSVQVTTNGQPMMFPGCEKVDGAFDEEGNFENWMKDQGPYAFPFVCPYDQFLDYFDEIRAKGSISTLCAQEFVAPQ